MRTEIDAPGCIRCAPRCMCAFEGVYKYMMRGSFSPWGAKVGMGESRLMNFNDAYRHVIGRRAASPCLPPSRNELPRTPPPLVPRSKGGRSSLNKFRPTAFACNRDFNPMNINLCYTSRVHRQLDFDERRRGERGNFIGRVCIDEEIKLRVFDQNARIGRVICFQMMETCIFCINTIIFFLFHR